MAELKEMTLRNFKSVAEKSYQFKHNTLVLGTNGTGKTTLNDGFCWSLFGKDSEGRDMGSSMKRRDENNQVVHGLEYAVEVVFDVDGTEKRFERVLTEKQTKEGVVTGHTTAYYVDRVRCATKKEYDAAVGSIITEDVMRMITDPFYFMSLKAEEKKAMLYRMAYGTETTDEAMLSAAEDAAKTDEKFQEVVDKIAGTSAEKTIGECAKKRSAINTELEKVGNTILGLRESAPEAEDWEAIATEIAAKKGDINRVSDQIAGLRSGNSANTALSELETAIKSKETELKAEEGRVRLAASTHNNKVQIELDKIRSNAGSKQEEITRAENKISEDIRSKDEMEHKLAKLRLECRAIQNGTYELKEEELYCPACGRYYEKQDVYNKLFSTKQALGKSTKVKYEAVCDEITTLTEKKAKFEVEMEELRAEYRKVNKTTIDVDIQLSNDPQCVQLRNELQDLYDRHSGMLQAQRQSEDPNAGAISQLTGLKEQYDKELEALIARQAKKKQIEDIDRKIEEKTKKQRALNQELADIERIEELTKQFVIARDKILLERVNGLFTIVSWNFVTEQLNGSDKVACNCFVEGMPYAEKNYAGKVNAGLDIINAICRNEGICFPIWIDNAESVVEYLDTTCQKVLLKVDESHHTLVIE